MVFRARFWRTPMKKAVAGGPIFIQTFLERDLRRFGVQVEPAALRRFWNMVAHHHGQIWNASEIGRSLGEAHTSVKRHLDILCGAFVMRQLPPWFEFENIGKAPGEIPQNLFARLRIVGRVAGYPIVIERWKHIPSSEHLGKDSPWRKC
jgi:hypothetical protein